MSFINKEDNDYHLIVTTHPYLVELGLGTMTTGTLYEWWNQSTAGGAYLNRMSVNSRGDLNPPTNGVEAVLGINSDTEFFWQGWKPHAEFENTGRYEKQDLSKYGARFGGDNPWTFVSDAGKVDVSNLSGTGVIGNHKECFIGGSLVEGDGGLEFKPDHSTAPTLNPDTLKNMSPIFDLINLNRYMASFKDYYPRALWEENSKTIGGVDTKELYANHELLTEIKTSKIGPYVEWSGEITFYINENHGTIDSLPITEWASFKLYLFDRASSKGSNKALTVKNLTYVAPKRDVTGKTFSHSVDGGYKESEVDDPSSHGAAELDVSYNTVTNKWDGGTPQLFAKLVTNIGKPRSMPTVEYFETNKVEDSLSNDDYIGVKVIPAKGTAMPIRPQNGNPHQWQPNYLDPDDVRCSTKATDKETLTVYNFNSKRSFERDEEVLLSKIDSQWHVFPLWSGNDVDEDETVAGDIGKWGEFSYLFTNSDYFFLADDGGRFSPREAEQSFHADYYSGDNLNNGVEYGVDGGYNYSQPFTNKDVREIRFKNGFAQQTSFDYLDSKLFGIRDKAGTTIVKESSEDKCSISTTSAVINAAGQVIPSPSEYTSRNAAHAGVFFGCIFPDGYVGVNDYLDQRAWDVVPKNAGAMTTTENYFITPNDNNLVKIFEDASNNRNNCRQPASAEPMGDLGGSKWSRRDSRASASLFAEYQQYKVTTFKQMPADVMTNASPEGKNGSPLQPIGRFVDFHDPRKVSTVKDSASKAFIQGVWLGKDAAGGDTAVYTENDSAFDFSPVSRNALTFRPCKLENYIQFGKNNVGSADLVKDLTQATVQETRRGFHVEASRTQLDDKRPCTYFFEDREEPNVSTRLLSDDGLIWGGDVSEQNRPRYNNLHEFNYWSSSQGAMRWTQNIKPNWKGSKGGAAFGVITTFNTITANSQIDFSTDNIYGMGAAANGRFSIQAGYANQDRTWGVSSFIQSYRQENILDLSIRLYQQHPREQLLFDPRTYAVHHFNPDVRYVDDKYTKDNGERTAFSRKIETEVFKAIDPKGKEIEFNYNYPLPSSEVDFQEVCRYEKFMEYKLDPSKEHEEGKDYSPQPLPVISYILSDATVDEGEIKPSVMAEKFWEVNTSRAGKLLPFRYKRRKVGIPTETGILISTNGSRLHGYPLSRIWSKSAIDLKENTSVIDLVSLIIVKNIGAGYAVGDILGNEAKGISLKVESVSAPAPPLQLFGEVLTFSCKDRGSLTASDSASQTATFGPDSDGPIKIETLQSGAGSGFDAYYVASNTYYQLNTDPKPFLIKRDGEEIVRIAADEPQGTHRKAGGSSEAEAGAFINESREVTYILDPTLKSANSQYDVFFHFHNDITMTWLASDPNFHGDVRNSTECAEQHVTVRINPR